MNVLDLVKPGALKAALDSQDHGTDVVPLTERRSPLTLGLLWVTMVTGFPTVFAGFEWYKAGLTMPQVLTCVFVSCLLLLCYTIPGCLLGAISGQTHCLLSRRVFGSLGSKLVSLQLVFMDIVWYGLSAMFLAIGLKGLFTIPISTPLLAAIFCPLMAFNNLFGFSGVANFAKFFAGPILVYWVLVAFCKASVGCPTNVFAQPEHQSIWFALTMVSGFVVGYGSWGNEADYWRYSKPKLGTVVIPIAVSVALGQVIFPITGWMMATITGVTDYAGATTLMNNCAFGGFSWIAGAVLIASLFAVNDSGLYGGVVAVLNIWKMQRKLIVLMLAGLGAAAAVWHCSNPSAFQLVTSLSCVMVPSVTVIIMTDLFITNKWFGIRNDYSKVPQFKDLPLIRWPGMVAWTAGTIVGLLTAGIIPGFEWMKIGVCSLQAWATCMVAYMILRPIEYSIERKKFAIDSVILVAVGNKPAGVTELVKR